MSYPFDWYWTVATNPTQRWAGARGLYVDTSDSAYITWDAIDGNDATNIDTEANLWDVLAQIALSVHLGGQGYGFTSYTTGTDITLTNPLPSGIEIVASAPLSVIMPQMNLPTSRPVGVLFYIRNFVSGNAVTFKDYTGATIQVLPAGMSLEVRNKSFATAVGSFSLTVFQNNANGLLIRSGVSPSTPVAAGTALDTDVTLAGNGDTVVSSQKAVKTYADTGLALKAPLASPTFTGTPAAPTAAPGTNTTQLSTTAFVKAAIDAVLNGVSAAFDTLAEIATELALKATIASPTFTGTPAAPTAAVDTNTTQLATTAMVLAQAASATPLIDGTAVVGTSTRYARGDHIHPTDTTRAPLASPTFTGTVGGTNVIPNATLAQMAANTVKGNNTGSTANASDLTVVPNNIGGTAVTSISDVSTTFIPRTLSVQNSGDTNDSSSGSGSFRAYNLTYTVPANFMVAARAIRVTAHFRVTTGSVVSAISFQIKYGGVIVALLAPGPPTINITNQQHALIWITQSTAVPGASVNTETVQLGNANGWAGATVESVTAQPVVLATNGSLAITIESQWASAGTGVNQLKLSQLIVEALN